MAGAAFGLRRKMVCKEGIFLVESNNGIVFEKKFLNSIHRLVFISSSGRYCQLQVRLDFYDFDEHCRLFEMQNLENRVFSDKMKKHR